jgi:hypothetical protein
MKKVYTTKDPLMIGHLKNTLAPLKSVKKSWQCAGCDEEIEGQFSECWKCGRSRGQQVARLDTVARRLFSIRNR